MVRPDRRSNAGRAETTIDFSPQRISARTPRRDHPYPRFTGAVGMSTRDFRAAMADYQSKVRQYAADLTAASLRGTDCVGTTIDQDNARRGIRAQILCAP